MRALGGDLSIGRNGDLPGSGVFLLCVMCSSTTAERQSLASRDRTCCLRRCLPARPLRYYGFRGSIAHPTQSLCTLRTRRRRRPRNTRYRAPATAYPDRSLTGRTTPAYLAHKQSMPQERMDCFVAALPCANASRLSQAMTEERRSPDGAQRNPGLKLTQLRPRISLRSIRATKVTAGSSVSSEEAMA